MGFRNIFLVVDFNDALNFQVVKLNAGVSNTDPKVIRPRRIELTRLSEAV